MPDSGDKPFGKGRPLKYLKSGHLIGTGTANVLIRLYNAIINSEIKDGQPSEVKIGDNKIIFVVKGAGTSGTGGNYRGEYEPSGNTTFFSGQPFAFGDVVRVSPTNTDSTTQGGTIIPGVYICALDGPTETDLPNHPLSPDGETTYWQWLATWPSSVQECNSDGSSVTVFSDEQTSP